MNKINYFYFFIVYCVVVACFGGAPAETIDEEIDILQSSSWQLDDRFKLDATLNFNEDVTKISGEDGCNSFTADLIRKNYQIEMTNFSNTEKYCEDLDDLDRDFLVALSKVRDYTLSKNKLVLLTAGQVEIGGKRASSLNFNKIER